MGTRCGDIDPSAILTLMKKEELSLSEAGDLLNKKSGLLGVSGVSSDMREVQKAAEKGSERARLAVEMFGYRIKKYIAAYAGVMNGVDHVVFTGGIGENSPLIRSVSCAGLSFMGVQVDETKNESCCGNEEDISTDNASVGVWVIPTNEELLLARDTVRCLTV